jgi:ankyrin repeat protein
MRENIQKQIIAELINIADIPGLPQAVRAPAAFSVCQCLAIGFNRVHNTDDIIFWLRYAHTLGSPFATRWVFRIAQALCPDASWFSQLRNVELVEHAARGPNELYLASSIRLNDFTGWGVRPLEDQKWGFISRDTIFESCYSVKFADFFREALDGFDDFWEFELDPPESSISYSSLGFTPIHCACLGGRLSTLRLLLRVGYSATQPTIHGITPLHLCIFFAECDIEAAVHLLLENGPLPKETTFGIYWPDYDLELSGSPLRWAIRTRNLKLVKLLLPHYTDYRPDDMRCALRNYFWEILDEILLTFPSQENMWDIYVFDFEQDSFSHWIAHGSERFSSIDHTLDVVQRHNLVSVEESRNVTGNLMIMMRKAVTEEHFYHIQRLLRLMTSSQIKQDNEIQGTPLTTAITRAKHNTMWTEIFEVLLGVYTIEELYWVRIRSGENVSVLHFAIIQESVVGVRSLLAKGLNPNQCMDTPQGITPLQLCFLKRGSVELCDTLLEFGADLYMESLPIRSSPVMGLFFGDRHENARLIDHVMKMDHPEQIVLQILFTTMASISTPEDQGYALLRYLVGMPNVAKHLNAPLPEGFTLLLYSAMHGFQEVTQLLLEAGADPLTKFRFDNQDVYPLQIICAMAFQQGKLHYTHGDLKIRQIIQKQRRLASIAMLLFEWQPKAKNSPFEGIIQLHIVSYIGLEQDIQHFLEEGQDLKTPGKWPRLSAKITSHRIRMAHEGFPENKTNEEDQKIHKKLWKELRDIFDPNLSSRIEMYDLILWETRAARQALQSVQTFAKRLRRFDPNGSDIEITNGEVGSLQPLE